MIAEREKKKGGNSHNNWVTCGAPTEALAEAAGNARRSTDKGSRREGRRFVRARRRRSTAIHEEAEDAIPHTTYTYVYTLLRMCPPQQLLMCTLLIHNTQICTEMGENSQPWGDFRRADGGSGRGGGGRGECRWIEDLVGKGAGSFALADGDRQRGGRRHPTQPHTTPTKHTTPMHGPIKHTK